MNKYWVYSQLENISKVVDADSPWSACSPFLEGGAVLIGGSPFKFDIVVDSPTSRHYYRVQRDNAAKR